MSDIRQPLIQLDPHQREVFWSNLRTIFVLWRRQGGKSFVLGGWGLLRMMRQPNHLVILCSASLALGKEWIKKEALVWRTFTQAYRDALAAGGKYDLRTTADDDRGKLLDIDAICGLFEEQRLETRIYHSNSVYSRSVVVAPNPGTAVGWTGDVALDEVGRIDELKDLLEAVEPIMIRNPEFRMRMSTTISPEDKHWSREIHGYPDGAEFPVSAAGNWYQSRTGYTCHRFDAWDAEAAGLKLYDTRTGAEMTPQEHREAQLDKSSWDRNYGLKETTGGGSAFTTQVLARCMERGRGETLAKDAGEPLSADAAYEFYPANLADYLDPRFPRLGLGYDVATTTKGKSNPSALALIQEVGLDVHARLILRFKSDDPEVARLLIELILADVRRVGLQIRGLGVDATNERYSARDTQRRFAGRLPVRLIISSESEQFGDVKIKRKDLLGSRTLEQANDGYLALPPERWIEDDFRLVRMNEGAFSNDLDEAGHHGDTFDAVKLAINELRGSTGGKAEAEAVGPAAYGLPRGERRHAKHPFARRFERQNQIRTHA